MEEGEEGSSVPQPETSRAGEQEPVDIVQKTNEAAARLEKATAEHKAAYELLKAQQVEAMAGGVTFSGKPEKKEETPSEYKDRVLKEGYAKPE